MTAMIQLGVSGGVLRVLSGNSVLRTASLDVLLPSHCGSDTLFPPRWPSACPASFTLPKWRSKLLSSVSMMSYLLHFTQIDILFSLCFTS